MARRVVAPSLADISQDVAGQIPVDIVLRWATGDRSADTHRELLAPHVVHGTVVSSDSVGLSKLTEERTLCEVLRLIDAPKQVLYEYGKALGGEAIGTWVADNSQTFYEGGIEVQKVVEQMIAAQRAIHSLPVQIGLGIHCGTFLSLGDGLFGPEVDVVEVLAEEYTEGGEIAVTDAVLARLDGSIRSKVRSKDFPHTAAYSLHYDDIVGAGFRASDATYPAPFPDDFLRYLRAQSHSDGQDETFRQYARGATVVLAKVKHPSREFLLDEFADLVLANAILREIVLDESMELVKSNGGLGIYLSDDPMAALEFAHDLREYLTSSGYDVAVAMAAGEVLVFPMGGSEREIAGHPVNVASKWAEDFGAYGRIFIDSTVEEMRDRIQSAERVTLSVSGVTLSALSL